MSLCHIFGLILGIDYFAVVLFYRCERCSFDVFTGLRIMSKLFPAVFWCGLWWFLSVVLWVERERVGVDGFAMIGCVVLGVVGGLFFFDELKRS